MSERFPRDADDPAEAQRYIENRAVQALMEGWAFERPIEPLVDAGVEWGQWVRARSPENVPHQTYYIYARFRGQGRVQEMLRSRGLPVVTTPDCGIEGFLAKRRLAHTVICRFAETAEYRAIASVYGDRRAERSGLSYMNHIDEGLAVLRVLGASEAARRAFCLHPIVQADADLLTNLSRLDSFGVDASIWALAFEYRRVANLALSTRELVSADDIELGPLVDVHVMLRADKLQNQKDFLSHHAEDHPRREALDRYFRLWHRRLGIDSELQSRCFAAMDPWRP